MALAWLVHGLLLDRMSRQFVETRLKDEVAFLEHQIRDSSGRLDTLQTGDYFQEVFHHAFAIHSDTQTIISPENWAPLLMPLVESGEEGTLRVSGAEIAEAPSDILAYRKSFHVDDQPIVVIVSEDLGALSRSQAELHAWTAVVSLLLILLLVGVLWLGINLSMRPVVSLKAALKRLQDGEISRIDVSAPRSSNLWYCNSTSYSTPWTSGWSVPGMRWRISPTVLKRPSLPFARFWKIPTAPSSTTSDNKWRAGSMISTDNLKLKCDAAGSLVHRLAKAPTL